MGEMGGRESLGQVWCRNCYARLGVRCYATRVRDGCVGNCVLRRPGGNLEARLLWGRRLVKAEEDGWEEEDSW